MFIIPSNENTDASIAGCGLASDGISLSTVTRTKVRATNSTVASIMSRRVFFATFGYRILSIGFSITLSIISLLLSLSPSPLALGTRRESPYVERPPSSRLRRTIRKQVHSCKVLHGFCRTHVKPTLGQSMRSATHSHLDHSDSLTLSVRRRDASGRTSWDIRGRRRVSRCRRGRRGASGCGAASSRDRDRPCR